MSETFDPARWRPAPFLPEKEARDTALIFVVAVILFAISAIVGLVRGRSSTVP